MTLRLQGLWKWFGVFLNLTLTDRNMQAKFGLKAFIFGDVSQSERLSEIEPPLKTLH
jgi:hypothetical protein